MKTYNWRPFLERWSADWAGSPGARAESDPGLGGASAAEGPRGPWLGFAGADPGRIGALEERLGPDVVLPPTFRSFLAVTDGWRPAGTDVPLLGTTEGTRWYGDPRGPQGIDEAGREGASAEGASAEGASAEGEAAPAGLWGRALRLSGAVAGPEVLLDPGEVSADGEWAAYLHRGRPGGSPERYESFMELMQALFRSFHHGYRDTPGFENDTTRELDAEVEEARLACLRGEAVDGSLKVFADAEECGRPRARELRVQMEALLSGGRTRERVVGPLDDPLYGAELLPLAVAPGAVPPEGTAEEFRRGYAAGDRERAGEVLRAVVDRTFRYEASGPFGDAVDRAREQARWGDTEAAWHLLATAVADWEPYGDEHLAPVGLLADPLLGPVITAERGRYLLETPRGAQGRAGAAGAGAGAGDVVEDGATSWDDGLAWLADDASPDSGGSGLSGAGDGRDRAYRFVFARGVTPEALAGVVGQGPLLPPAGEDEVAAARSGPEGGELRRVARVGRCGDGWSFVHESRAHLSEAFVPERLTGLGESASVGGESVTVWCERGGGPSEPPSAFHLSYAEDGERVYGFTVRGEEIEEWGELPDPLDPEELFPEYEEEDDPEAVAPGLDPDDEYEALDALSEEFGICLPEFAIRHGRLPTVLTRSWLRPAEQGEPS
ncbi:SMI1/KNR4 family protein [Streptomyces sp. NPDC059142]|uniref:SMI1/KNR4 family protein n=1 Tax=Streptomyces sp. NPDC059142 TaxID=3346739 RepID=UPI003678307B